MGQLLPVARPQYTDGNGMPLAGGTVAFAQPGTGGATLRPVYADEAETIPLQNPVPLDSSGITFSGGSQVSVWGFGAYELFIRDNSGNLIYSAIIDTIAGFTGGTIAGSLQVNGDLSVLGNITDAQTISGVNANLTGNLGVSGLTNTGNLGVFGNVQIDGTTNINSSLTVGGNSTFGGTVVMNEFAVSGSGTAQFNGASIGSVNWIDTQFMRLGGVFVPKFYGSSTTIAGGATINIPYPTQLQTLYTAQVSIGPGDQGTLADYAPIILVADAAHLEVFLGSSQNPGETFPLYWLICGD